MNSSHTPAGIAQPHRVAPRIPGVEVANDRDRARIRRPDGKPHAVHAVDRHDAGAKVRRQLEMPPFVEQVQIELAEQRAEGIGILGLLHRARPGDAQQIGFARCPPDRRTAHAARPARAGRASRHRRAPAPRPPARRAGRRARSAPSRCRADPARRTDRRACRWRAPPPRLAAGRQFRPCRS